MPYYLLYISSLVFNPLDAFPSPLLVTLSNFQSSYRDEEVGAIRNVVHRRSMREGGHKRCRIFSVAHLVSLRFIGVCDRVLNRIEGKILFSLYGRQREGMVF